MGASIDLSKAHLHRNYGDLVAILSWLNEERALFLVPRYRKGAPWFVIMEPAAHTWRDDDSRNIRNAVLKAHKACEVLGIEPNPENCRRIVALVNDAIPDLLTMPSAPPKEYYRGAIGHMVLREDGKVVGSEEIRMEKEGVAYA